MDNPIKSWSRKDKENKDIATASGAVKIISETGDEVGELKISLTLFSQPKKQRE